MITKLKKDFNQLLDVIGGVILFSLAMVGIIAAWVLWYMCFIYHILLVIKEKFKL